MDRLGENDCSVSSKKTKVNRPSVVFIDEIDALGAIRHGAAGDEGMDSYHAGAQERETTLNQLLIELDGFDTGKGVVFLGATNRMDMLDPALLRPGRFDRKIAIRPPQAKGRLEILRVHAKAVKLDDSVDLWLYAKNLPSWSGAELAQLLQEAALVAVRHGGTRIGRHDMDQALDRLTMGPERLGLGRRQPVHRRMAAHEVGLAMTSHLLRRLENAQIEFADRVSIVPRGETIARTIFDKLEDEAYMFEWRPTLIHRMQVMLGGRAAEEVMYGQNTSTFSVQHLPDASWLARKMVSIWNMEGDIAIRGDLNPWAQSESFTGPPLEFEGGLYDNYGFHEKSLNYDLVDDVASRSKALLGKVYQQTLRLLKDHKAALSKAIYVSSSSRLWNDGLVDVFQSKHVSSNSPKFSIFKSCFWKNNYSSTDISEVPIVFVEVLVVFFKTGACAWVSMDDAWVSMDSHVHLRVIAGFRVQIGHSFGLWFTFPTWTRHYFLDFDPPGVL
ncbi:unnamed protein product [Calypogeia fissa]